jgi:hypothetical protein
VAAHWSLEVSGEDSGGTSRRWQCLPRSVRVSRWGLLVAANLVSWASGPLLLFTDTVRRGPTSLEYGWAPPIRVWVKVRLGRWTESGGDQSNTFVPMMGSCVLLQRSIRNHDGHKHYLHLSIEKHRMIYSIRPKKMQFSLPDKSISLNFDWHGSYNCILL